MAYVLLAIGALMSVVGAYAIITGAHIVQVEAGWTSVIAGSILFVGGAIMMGLGVLLRALLKVQAALVASPIAVPAGDGVVVLPGPPKLPETAPAPPPVPAAKIEPQVENQLLPSRPPRPPIPPQASPIPQVPTSVPAAPAAPQPGPPGPPPPPIDPAKTETGAPATFEPVMSEVATPHPSDDYKLETPSTPEHDLVAAHPVPPPEDDWLDRAFAEFDQELPTPPPPARSDPPHNDLPTKREAPKLPKVKADLPATDAPPEFEPAFADAEPAVAAVVAPEPQSVSNAAAPPTTGPAATVIGRYESEGTSYVMYADGSIEAHSASGVYRFASMAELKAFIER